MPKDADIGRALAAAIVGKHPKIKGARFDYDRYLEDADLPKNVQVFVSTNRLNHTRLTRAQWQEDITLLMELRVKQPPNIPDTETVNKFVDAWLEAWDSLIEFIKTESINGMLPNEVSQDERYDPTELNSNQRLVCVCNVLYKNI